VSLRDHRVVFIPSGHTHNPPSRRRNLALRIFSRPVVRLKYVPIIFISALSLFAVAITRKSITLHNFGVFFCVASGTYDRPRPRHCRRTKFLRKATSLQLSGQAGYSEAHKPGCAL
jgi:hypothetical protein